MGRVSIRCKGKGCRGVSRNGDDWPVLLARRRFTGPHLRQLRQLVTSAAREVGLDRDRGYDLALAVSEAAGNVIRHAGPVGHLELIRDDNRALIVHVIDDGPGMPPAGAAARPGAEHDSGRGLYLMQQLCDHVEYRTGPTGTTVRMVMNLANR